MESRCKKCFGFGYVLFYNARVERKYCDCEAGKNRKKEVETRLKSITRVIK